MVGVLATTHRRFAYETHKHDQSRPRRWSSGYGRCCGRYRRCCRRAEFHDEHEPVHRQHCDHAIDDLDEPHHHDAIDEDAEGDATEGFVWSPVPEYGQIGVGVKLRIGLELGFGL